METVAQSVARNFRGPPPPLDPTRPPVAPPPEKELSAREVLGLPAPRWPTRDELRPVAEARAAVKQAEDLLAKLEAEAAAARAAASARAPTPEDLRNYARTGQLPGKDHNAAAAGEKAGQLVHLVALARADVAAKKAALLGALQDAPAAIAAHIDPEHKRALRAWAAAAAGAALAELRLRALEQDVVGHFRGCGLPTDRLPCGFPPHGVHFAPGVFEALLDGTHPMPSLEVWGALEALRQDKVIDYPPLDDPRELGLARVSDRALRGVYKILETVAAAAPAGAGPPEPGPDRRVADPAGTGAAAGPDEPQPQAEKGD
jgi:hypothetical protein